MFFVFMSALLIYVVRLRDLLQRENFILRRVRSKKDSRRVDDSGIKIQTLFDDGRSDNGILENNLVEWGADTNKSLGNDEANCAMDTWVRLRADTGGNPTELCPIAALAGSKGSGDITTVDTAFSELNSIQVALSAAIPKQHTESFNEDGEKVF